MLLAEARADDVDADVALVGDPGARPSIDGLTEACLALVSSDDWRPGRALALMSANGLTASAELVAVAAAVARRLGERWAADGCGFVDVTVGFERLATLVAAIEASASFGSPRLAATRERDVVSTTLADAVVARAA